LQHKDRAATLDDEFHNETDATFAMLHEQLRQTVSRVVLDVCDVFDVARPEAIRP
jgi:hypothetical protein